MGKTVMAIIPLFFPPRLSSKLIRSLFAAIWVMLWGNWKRWLSTFSLTKHAGNNLGLKERERESRQSLILPRFVLGLAVLLLSKRRTPKPNRWACRCWNKSSDQTAKHWVPPTAGLSQPGQDKTSLCVGDGEKGAWQEQQWEHKRRRSNYSEMTSLTEAAAAHLSSALVMLLWSC